MVPSSQRQIAHSSFFICVALNCVALNGVALNGVALNGVALNGVTVAVFMVVTSTTVDN